jgi:dolichol-phosphate mannosyltransferase
MPAKTLIFIPTYNESENAPRMCAEIHKLGLDADVLFVDDNSPDGTGQTLEGFKARFPRLIVQHRSGKLGIGSAHFEAIQWAYDHGYELMVTLDCDFTHSPSDIPKMIAATESADVAVGSRWVNADSLPGWNFFRRFMTMAGHFLTRCILGVPEDASGAFRTYRLDRIPRDLFRLIKSRGYSFFFESLFIIHKNAFSVAEVGIVLPARTYGNSKMTTSAALRSARFVFELFFADLRRPEQFLLERKMPALEPSLADPQNWDDYWGSQSETSGVIYELIAGVYRRLVIRPNLNAAINRTFPAASKLLHAGCGSGQVDVDLQRSMSLTGLDISPGALRLYCRNNPLAREARHGSIFALPYPPDSFDGIYNLGVMEHFTPEEIHRILAEFRRVVRPGGRIVLFWPHACGSSVLVLKAVHFFLRRFTHREKPLHPPEITHMQSAADARALLDRAGFELRDYRFGPSDLFVQSVIVGQRPAAACTHCA